MIMNDYNLYYERISYLLRSTKSFKVDGVIKEMLKALMSEYKSQQYKIHELSDSLYKVYEVLKDAGYYEED